MILELLTTQDQNLAKRLARNAFCVERVLLKVVRARPMDVGAPDEAPVERGEGIIRYATVDQELATAQALVMDCRRLGI